MAHRRAIAVLVLLAVAPPAQSLARMPGERAARIRASLTRAVERHPDVITQRWFLRKAGLVQFKLPVTLRVRPEPAPTATVDLGASLGSRSIALGGSLSAAVTFSDSYDGGTLGSVGIEFQPSDTNVLRTSSIPLLWNADVSQADMGQGCRDFTGAEAIDRLRSGPVVGDDDWLGPSQQPFPAGSAQDTVLRTNALRLQVANRGIAQSSGRANLFGNIPGRNVSVDVTLSLTTVINAIERVVDPDDDAGGLRCRQLWTGAVQNTIPGIRLQGQLRISPAITSDGELRIARVTVASPPATPARTALTACLLPVTTYAGTHVPADRPCGSAGDPDLGVAPLADGSQVSVAGDISVDQVSVDVIIGDG
jgi:hypothetical protein